MGFKNKNIGMAKAANKINKVCKHTPIRLIR